MSHLIITKQRICVDAEKEAIPVSVLNRDEHGDCGRWREGSGIGDRQQLFKSVDERRIKQDVSNYFGEVFDEAQITGLRWKFKERLNESCFW